jgi:hypothetical protein
MSKFKNIPLVGIIALLSTIVTGSWVADGLKGEALFSEWFPDLKEWKLLATLGALMLFLLSIIWLYNYRKVFLAVKTLEQLYSCKPHACLILLMSTPNIVPSGFSFPLKIIDKSGYETTLKGVSLKEDIEALNSINYWNWQQLLRGIIPHQSSLKYPYLIGSKDSGRMKGSFGFLDNAETLIKKYCPYVKKIFKAEVPVNFEDLKELTKIIYTAVQELKELKIDEEDIIIDVTGGQKTTSIAGAVVTLNSQVTFQYVQTNEPYNVVAYDVVIQSPVSA